MAADDVSLPDLEVIAQFSLAVRAATAPRAAVIAALEADLQALTGTRGPRRSGPSASDARRPSPGRSTPTSSSARTPSGKASGTAAAPATKATRKARAASTPAERAAGAPPRKRAPKASTTPEDSGSPAPSA